MGENNNTELTPHFINQFSDELKEVYTNLIKIASLKENNVVDTLDWLKAIFLTQNSLGKLFLSKFEINITVEFSEVDLLKYEDYTELKIIHNGNVIEMLRIALNEFAYNLHFDVDIHLLNSELLVLAMLSRKYFLAYSTLNEFCLDYVKAKEVYNTKYSIENKIFLPLTSFPFFSTIYKFLPPVVDVIKSICIDGKIKFSPATQLNDKLEMKTKVDQLIDFKKFVNPTDTISKEILEKELMKAYDTYGLQDKIELNQFKEFYKNFSVQHSDDIANFLNNITNIISSPALNLYQTYNFENLGVLSLTTKLDSSPMWAHYANNHTGVAIEFDLNNAYFYDSNPQSQLSEVLYKDKLHSFSNLMDSIHYNNDLVQDICFFQKTIDWQYESEWRIVKNINKLEKREFANSYIYLDTIPTNLIKSVIFGIDSEISFKKDCIELLKNNEVSRNIKFYNIEINNDTLNYELQEIE